LLEESAGEGLEGVLGAAACEMPGQKMIASEINVITSNARKNVLFIFSPDIKDIVVKVGLLGKIFLVPMLTPPPEISPLYEESLANNNAA
jgi:hypothetical protein